MPRLAAMAFRLIARRPGAAPLARLLLVDVRKIVAGKAADLGTEPRVGFARLRMNAVNDQLLAVAEKFYFFLASAVRPWPADIIDLTAEPQPAAAPVPNDQTRKKSEQVPNP